MPSRRAKSTKGQTGVRPQSHSTDKADTFESGHGDGHVDLVSLLEQNGSEEAGSDIVVEHLASDLPIGSGFTSSDKEVDDAAEGAKSTTPKENFEDINKEVFAQFEREMTASLRRKTDAEPPKVKKGKLKRPTRSLGRKADPPKSLSQRPLKGPAQHDRPDTYDLPNSPEVALMPPKRNLAGASQVSPLRKQRRIKQMHGEQLQSDARSGLSNAQTASFEDVPTVASPHRTPQKVLQEGASPRPTGAKKVRPSQNLHDSENHHNAGRGPFLEEDEDEEEASETTSAAVIQPSPRRSQRVQRQQSADIGSGDEVADYKQDSDHESEIAKDFPEAQVIIPKVVKIRPSELYPRNARGKLEDVDETLVSSPQEEASRKRKPGAGPSDEPSRKRVKQRDKRTERRPRYEKKQTEKSLFVGSESSEESELLLEPGEPSDSQDDSPLADRLLGQANTLREVHQRTLKIYDDQGPPGSETDGDVKKILKIIKQATKTFAELLKGPTNANQLPDPPEELDDIKRGVLHLCGKDKKKPVDFEDQHKSESIYQYLIPRLVQLTAHAAECYLAIDETTTKSDGSITLEHLGVLTRLINLVGEIGEAAKNKYQRPDAKLVIISRVHNGLVVPLRRVQKRFSEHIRRHKDLQAIAVAESQRQAWQAEQRRIEEYQAQQKARTARLSKKWRALHDERRFVEPHILPRDKQYHLRLVEHATELDQNGDAFERENFFRPRSGPPPALVEAARIRAANWTEHEVNALFEGLQRFADDGDLEENMVFERIFRQYCIRNGPLNKYNVTEIVTVAADAKPYLQNDQMEDQGQVEDWVKTIPLWTNPRMLIGQENDGGGMD